MEKQVYQTPEAEIVQFPPEDIIRTSGGLEDDDDGAIYFPPVTFD